MAKILYVEDDILIAQPVVEMLQDAGHDVTHAADAAAAKVHFSNAQKSHRPFGLVLTDWRYPEGGGEAVIRHVRDQQPAIPVIVVSGTKQEPEALRDKEPALMKDVPILAKPYMMGQVIAAIEKAAPATMPAPQTPPGSARDRVLHRASL